VLVHRSLDSQQEVRRALHLVEGQPVEVADQGVRLLPRPLQDLQVIEGEVGAVVNGLDQGALAGLPRSRDHDHRKGAQRLGQSAPESPGEDV
jgi:hypothetical protein